MVVSTGDRSLKDILLRIRLLPNRHNTSAWYYQMLPKQLQICHFAFPNFQVNFPTCTFHVRESRSFMFAIICKRCNKVYIGGKGRKLYINVSVNTPWTSIYRLRGQSLYFYSPDQQDETNASVTVLNSCHDDHIIRQNLDTRLIHSLGFHHPAGIHIQHRVDYINVNICIRISTHINRFCACIFPHITCMTFSFYLFFFHSFTII